MKLTLLSLLVVSCHAFTMAPAFRPATTALSGYHYTNGAEPDPSSMSSSNDSSEASKGLKPVFSTYGTPEPTPNTSEDKKSDKKKGLNPVFVGWEDVGFSADGLQRESS